MGTSFISSSTTRAATVGITLPTEPRFLIASSPSNMQVTGDISVWPNAASICVPGKVSDICRSRVSDAGAAPHEITLNLTSRGFACCALHTACHWAGTRKIPVTFSAASTSSKCPGSNAPSGWITVGSPSSIPVNRLPTPAIWKKGTPMNPTSLASTPWVKRLAIVCPVKFVWVSTAPLGRPVVPEVYMISAGESLGTSTGCAGSPGSFTRSS